MKKHIVTIGLILLAGVVSAALLVEETWNYGVGSSSTTWTGGTGYNATAWNPAYSFSSGAAIVNGLTFGSMSVSGNAVHVGITAGTSTVTTTYGTLRRQMNTTSVTSGDLWVAYLFAFDTTGSTVPLDEQLEVRSDTNLRTGISENSSSVYQRKGTITATSATSATIKGGETLLYISKFADLGVVGTSNSKSWVLTAAGYANMMANGGVLEANLDAYALVTTINTNHLSFTQSGTGYVEIVPIGRGSSTPSFTVDELRYGTTLQDVVAIPEPATIGLFSCMAAAVVILRRSMSRDSR